MMKRIALSQKEFHRAQVLEMVRQGHLTLAEAAQYLKVSVRQLRRIHSRYQEQGAAGLIRGNRGRPAANRTSQETQENILTWVCKSKARYNDTHLQEVLAERVELAIGRETLRRLLRSQRLAPKRTRRSAAYFRRRDRKPRGARWCRGTAVGIAGWVRTSP